VARGQRDPLSLRYDGVVDDVLNRAARAYSSNRGVQAWIASPRAEYRAVDRGGRTAHERAFTRAAYYVVWRIPINEGIPPDWSLKLTWGADTELRPSSAGRLARPVLVRLFPRSQARVRGEHWNVDGRRSQQGHRIDD
jgi:hypothetical protein